MKNRIVSLAIIVIVALIGCLVCLLYKQGPVPSLNTNNSQNNVTSAQTTPTTSILTTASESGNLPPAPPSQASSTWENSIPIIRPVLKQVFNGMKNGEIVVEQDRPIQIIQETTLADGASEAIVGLGCGGASSVDVTVMRRTNDTDSKPALFTQDNAQPSPLIHLHGAISLAGDAVALLPQQDAVIVGSWSQAHSAMGKEYPATCTLTAYRWNNATNVFAPDKKLTADVHDRFCTIAKTWPGSGPFVMSQ